MMRGSQLNGRKLRRSKRVEHQRGVDRLSTLPDSLLCHILSFLPTKYAVRTSILSHRWKHVWTFVRNLSFDDRLYLNPSSSTHGAVERFAEFVHTVIRQTEPGNIAKLSIYCSRPTDISSFNNWLTSALQRSVADIELYLGQQSRIELPDGIATSESLEVLKLQSDFVIKLPPTGYCFPRLKVLHLWVLHPENNFTDNIVPRCPGLEDLRIKAILKHDGERLNFIISSSTLKKLALTVALEEFYFIHSDYTVSITTPKLECLRITADIFGELRLHDLRSVNEAILEISYAEWAQGDPKYAVWLMEGVSATKCLTVSAGIMSALDLCYESFKPSFPNLAYLKVMVGQFGWRILPRILSSSSILKTLVVHKQCWFEETEQDFGWLHTGDVPQCLVKRVKTIHVKGLTGDEEEMKLLEYWLEHSKVLGTLIVTCKESIPRTRLWSLQRKLQRVRRGCNIVCDCNDVV